MGFFDALANLFTSAKPRVFISYQHRWDRKYRDMLSAWNANSTFNFEFERCSPTVAIDSQQAPTIKGQLTKMMKQADYLLVIVGRYTHRSKWVKWEIARAKKAEVDLKLVAVKLDKSYKTPQICSMQGQASLILSP